MDKAIIADGFVFFWGAQPPNGVFSNWYKSTFVHNGKTYNCSEQFMMEQKALLFGDTEVADLIMQQTDPKKQKFLGRQVRGFDHDTWMEKCEDIMVPGLISKFVYDEYASKILESTGNAIIVEASPLDKIWGIGLAEDHPSAKIQAEWQGLNLLGKVLMRTRDELRR